MSYKNYMAYYTVNVITLRKATPFQI